MKLKVKPFTLHYIICSFVLFLFHQTLTSQIKFTEVSKSAGLEHVFKVYEGTFGGGACVLDFNNDGWMDLFLASGTGTDKLYKNNGDGSFTNVYNKSGLESSSGYVTQSAVSSDINKDGFVDLFISTISTKGDKKIIPRASNLIFINKGDSTFSNETESFGLDKFETFSQGAMFGDINSDGYPDLYVGNYFRQYSGELNILNDAMIVSSNEMAEDLLLINNKGKSFKNKYSDYGLSHKGFGFGGTFTDFDNDNDLDIIVNHDFGYKSRANLLLSNQYPKKTFKDVGPELGMDLKINAMGTAIGDYNNDGLMDYFTSNIRANNFLVNQGIGKGFINKSWDLGTAFTILKDDNGRYMSISWGANFADFDQDGDLDLFVSNGSLNPNTAPVPDFFLENIDGKFIEKGREVGVADYGIGRGSVVFDYDNDGDLDLLVVNQNLVSIGYQFSSETRLYRNDSKTQGNWAKIKLIGKRSDSNGLGTRVEIISGNKKMIREIDGGSGHMSQNSPIAHFGLGKEKRIDSIIIKWIGGKTQILVKQPINQLIVVEQVEKMPDSISLKFIILACLGIGLILFLYIRKKAN